MKKKLISAVILLISIFLIVYNAGLAFDYYEASAFNIEIKANTDYLILDDNESKLITVDLKNNSRERILSDKSDNSYFLSYHVYNEQGETVKFENDRTPFGKLSPFGIVKDIPLEIKSIERPGRYVYKIDIVYEGVRWYSESGNSTFDIVVDINLEAK